GNAGARQKGQSIYTTKRIRPDRYIFTPLRIASAGRCNLHLQLRFRHNAYQATCPGHESGQVMD
ncbi:MAG: hypothetical protein WAU91_18170, partial [Desulfatitalea sp.]